jgi:hypothetical protein
MSLVIWLVLYGGAIASIFFLAGYFAFKHFIPPRVYKQYTWQYTVGRVCLLTCMLIAMLCMALLLFKAGLPASVYALFAIFFVLFNSMRASIFRSSSYPRMYSFLFAGLISSTWFFYPHWIITDAVAYLSSVFVLILFKEMTMKQAAVISLAVILFDTSMVFFSGFMQEFAIGSGLEATPMVFLVNDAPSFIGISMIGLGDIIFPGIIIMAIFREAKIRSLPSLPVAAIIGYFYGLVVTVIVYSIFHSPQPATLYLIPGVLLGFWVALLVNRVPMLSVLRGAGK